MGDERELEVEGVQAMKFQPGDVVRIRGGQDLMEFGSHESSEPTSIAHLYFDGRWLQTQLENIELVRRKGTVVFETQIWNTSDNSGSYVYGIFRELDALAGRKVRVSVEVLEEGM